MDGQGDFYSEILGIRVKNLIVGGLQNLLEADDFIRVQMSLTDLNFGNGTPGDVAAHQLKPGGQHLLRHADALPQTADVPSDLLFNGVFHAGNVSSLLHSIRRRGVDIIIMIWYNNYALIQVQ